MNGKLAAENRQWSVDPCARLQQSVLYICQDSSFQER